MRDSTDVLKTSVESGKNASLTSTSSTPGGRSRQPLSGGMKNSYITNGIYNRRKRSDALDGHDNLHLTRSNLKLDNINSNVIMHGDGDSNGEHANSITTNIDTTTVISNKEVSKKILNDQSSYFDGDGFDLSTHSLTDFSTNKYLLSSTTTLTLNSVDDNENTVTSTDETTTTFVNDETTWIDNNTSTDNTNLITENITESSTQNFSSTLDVNRLSTEINFIDIKVPEDDNGKYADEDINQENGNTGILKITEDVVDEFTTISSEINSSLIFEKPQQDYPNVYANNDDNDNDDNNIEIIKLNSDKLLDKNLKYSHHEFYNEKNDIISNELKFNDDINKNINNHFDNLEILLKKKSDEEFLREYKRRFSNDDKLNNINLSTTTEKPSTTEKINNTNKLFVNVTISNGDSIVKPIYVLSVSLSNDKNNNIISDIKIDPENVVSMKNEIFPPPPKPPTQPPPVWSGGECDCSCPCIKNTTEEWENAENQLPLFDYDYETNTESNIDNKTFNFFDEKIIFQDKNYTENNQTTDRQEGETSETPLIMDSPTSKYSQCGTTPLPPEPTILILEGEMNESVFFLFFLLFPKFYFPFFFFIFILHLLHGFLFSSLLLCCFFIVTRIFIFIFFLWFVFNYW